LRYYAAILRGREYIQEIQKTMSDTAVLKGLAAIQARLAADEAKRSANEDYVKAKWFSLKDKQRAKGVFLQEMDEDSPNYSEKNGLGLVAIEHNNPAKGMFMRKALCTLESEGACWACEQHRKDYKAGWKQKPRLYINFLLLESPQLSTFEPANEPTVVVLSQGLSESQISPALFEQAGLFGTITSKEFQIKRSGAGFNDTSYLLTALSEHTLDDLESYELYDLDKIVRHVPYDQQAAHYLDGGTQATEAPASEEAAPAGDAGTTEEDAW
jgi:hypothetical protein